MPELAERLWAKARADGTGCWVWFGGKSTMGYGQIWNDGRKHQAHRVAYEIVIGEIPGGLEIDHLCRVKACINPSHLEAVTHRENVMRAEGIPYRFTQNTHCPRGHEFTPENTYVSPGKSAGRRCRICQRESLREYRAQKRAEGGSR